MRSRARRRCARSASSSGVMSPTVPTVVDTRQGIARSGQVGEDQPMTTKISYSHGTSETPLLGETIGANFERTCRVHGDREALVDITTGRRWTYAQLGADVDTLALGLLDLGVDKGDRVGIWAPNCA